MNWNKQYVCNLCKLTSLHNGRHKMELTSKTRTQFRLWVLNFERTYFRNFFYNREKHEIKEPRS